MTLSVSTQHSDRAVLVRIGGDIDLATRDEFDSGLAAAIETSGAAAVEVDLSGVEFIDSSGIAVLLQNRRRAEAAGIGYSIVAASDLVQRILSVAGVWRLLAGEQV